MFKLLDETLRFYGKCVIWAAAGTLERANAWYWFVGVPIVAAAGWHFGGGILIIPDNLQDFFVFMVLTVGVSWAIFFLLRFAHAPAHLLKEVEADREALNNRLITLGLERPFFYDHAEFNTKIRGKKIDVGATVYFSNSGDKLIKWTLKGAYIEVNGCRHSFTPTRIPYIMNKGQRGWFHYPPCKDAPFKKWPVTVDIMFDVTYDNSPSLSERGCKKVVRYVISSTNQQNIPAADIMSSEY